MDTQLQKPESPRSQPGERLVYLVTTDQSFGVFLAQQLGHFGYQLQIVKDGKSLDLALAEHHSAAILVDISTTQLVPWDIKIFNELDRAKHSEIPLMFISDVDDQWIRVKAIRAGGSAFLPKPIDIVSLIDRLDVLGSSRITEPYRVLIIEDQQTVANYYKMVLNMAGMEAAVATEVTHILQLVADYHPDLILLDLYMPEINGIEVARLIRQIDEYISIPIVFLSSEDDFTKQMEAMSIGGDDFVRKPIRAANLVSLVRNRMDRLKTLRSFMVRDSLTGLLNHTTFRTKLNQEINRCKRTFSPMALAMLDIDHFKQVNDRFGHAAGDSVLKSISRLLKQRLRKTDLIGRYGGEEFVALLLDTDADQAFEVIDELRQHFSQIEHFPDREGGLQVTFSGGIAAFPEFNTANSLSEAADQALYTAKSYGRNRIVKTG